jgi:thioredoxin 1
MKNKKSNIVLILSFLVLILWLVWHKDKINCFVTNYYLQNNNIGINSNDSIAFFTQFDNSNNLHAYQLSLIELGGRGCIPCKQMDTVLLAIKDHYKENINIKTIRITDKSNKKIAKYFGVNTIPTQIILDKNGNEIYRHTGFISVDELKNKLNKFFE